ncbi:hypothetical protein KCP76_05135 [Salmonella enterica subsp. enterica serovar Weltevreden]|nr:hypothetical protein KCP76_05135 [Salmonella enterica subsp. enterica serovar Weltevreden]
MRRGAFASYRRTKGFNLGLRDVMSWQRKRWSRHRTRARILAHGTYYRAISSVVRLTGIRRLA